MASATQFKLEPESPVWVGGGGILGLWQALIFARAGFSVTLYERQPRGAFDASSALAGAMLAPECERDGAEDVITVLGRDGFALWRAEFPDLEANGSLVVAHARDLPELDRFAAATEGHTAVDADAIAALEPDLTGRFSRGLYFAGEAHVAPRDAMAALADRIEAAGGKLIFEQAAPTHAPKDGLLIDCRGIAARDHLPALRGVKGEMVVLKTSEIALSRPVRLMHPRHPLYIVPWGQGHYMVGATMIETEQGGVTAKSLLELLSAAYTLNPAFGEAEIAETRQGLRPAFPDNIPKIMPRGRVLYVNGAYRHGFLLAPVLARMALDYAQNGRGDVSKAVRRIIGEVQEEVQKAKAKAKAKE